LGNLSRQQNAQCFNLIKLFVE